ncbi:hypothetical protein [Candidatus Coxiella mudrowiae]|nr:hypothetical protein [Candidatus Coxiella mudrowiae]
MTRKYRGKDNLITIIRNQKNFSTSEGIIETYATIN